MALAAVNMNAVEARESKESGDTKDTGTDKKRKAKTSVGVEKLKKAMGVPDYEGSVPEAVRTGNEEKLKTIEAEMANLELSKDSFAKLR